MNNYFDKSKEKINVIAKNKKIDRLEQFADSNIIKSFQSFDREVDRLDVSSQFNAIDSGNITTHQLKNIDYSIFSNHVFFDSAVHKINYAFSDIINYPYDRPISETINYMNQLDGYTRYVLENIYPKSIHSLNFTENIKIKIVDKTGFLLNDYEESSMPKEGLLSPTKNGYNYTFNILLNSDINTYDLKNQVVFKKTVVNQNKIEEGYVCYISVIEEKVYINFGIIQNHIMFNSKAEIPLGTNVRVSFNITQKSKFLETRFYINGNLKPNDTNNVKLNGNYEFSSKHKSKNAFFIIGNAEDEFYDDVIFHNFVGKIDDLIIRKIALDEIFLKETNQDSLTTNKNIVLMLKFNEPPGSYTNSALCIDHSGNKLHGIMINDNDEIIDDTTLYKSDSLTSKEVMNNSPVIIGTYPAIINEREKLIAAGKAYDEKNANIIFKLLPRHYFVNDAEQQSLPVYAETVLPSASSTKFNKFDKYENTHITNICLIWARYFDQLKLHVDSLEDLFNLDFDNINIERNVDAYMKMLCKTYNFDFKEILFDKTQYRNDNIRSENVDLNQLQNFIWKKILLNTQNINRSKGTLYSIESLFNSFNKNIKNFVSIRERSFNNIYNTQNINGTSQHKLKEIQSINFFNQPEGTFIESTPLKYKTDNITNSGLNDNWSLELFFNFNDAIRKQKLLNIAVNNLNSLDLNLSLNQDLIIITSDTPENTILLEAKCNFKNNDTKYCDITISYNFNNRLEEIFAFKDVNVLDSDKYLCVTQTILDNNIIINSILKTYGEILNDDDIKKSTLTIPYEENRQYLWRNDSLKILIGKNDIQSLYKTINFEGSVNCIKLWKKALEENDMLCHSNNIESISYSKSNILNYKDNIVFDFIPTTSTKNSITNNDYTINTRINDESNVNFNFNLIETSNKESLFKYKEIILNKVMTDVRNISNNNFVSVISYKSDENKKYFSTQKEFPAHENYDNINESYLNLLEIEMSYMKLINDDIAKLTTDVNDINRHFSGKEKRMSYNYNTLDLLREKYFENYKDNSYNLEKLRNIFIYFDSILNEVLSNMIPGQMVFNGFNFIYESNIIERNKLVYHNKYSNYSSKNNSFMPISYYNNRKF